MGPDWGAMGENVNGRIDVGALNGRPQVQKLVAGVKGADDRVVAFVQERPLVAICAAVAVGYLIGRVVTRVS